MPIEPKQFKKPVIKKRDVFEIIFDNCSSGKTTLDMLQSVANLAEESPAYERVEFIMPMQIGTEMKRRLFPDFLDEELRSKNYKNVNSFYRRNRDRIRIVDDDTSLAYKMFFTRAAFATLDELSSEETERVLKIAQAQIPGEERVDLVDLYEVLREFRELADEHFNDYLVAFKDKKRDIAHMQNAQNGEYKSDPKANAALSQKMLAHSSRRLFDKSPKYARRILQAMYSDQNFHHQVNAVSIQTADNGLRALRTYRRDKGEDAIMEYLLNHRDQKNESVVTLVVSVDRGAISGISNLRKLSHNVIIALRNKGLHEMLKTAAPEEAAKISEMSLGESYFKDSEEERDELRFARRAAGLIKTGIYNGVEAAATR